MIAAPSPERQPGAVTRTQVDAAVLRQVRRPGEHAVAFDPHWGRVVGGWFYVDDFLRTLGMAVTDPPSPNAPEGEAS